MNLKNLIYFPLVKIIIGIASVVALVALGEVIRTFLLDKTSLGEQLKNGIVAAIQITLSITGYITIFRIYEKRRITEFSLTRFPIDALTGLLLGLGIQSLVILIIYLAGGYAILQLNPSSSVIPGFIAAIVAGVVAEIILRGIIFRLTEAWLGTGIAIIISASLFAIIHARSEGATLLSVLATSFQAGILLSSVYVYSRSLWLPVFLHFAWDFAEPAIFGGFNPGIHVPETLLFSSITGNELLTGGANGPGNSLPAALCCLVAAAIFLFLAKRRNNFVRPAIIKIKK